MKFKIGKYDAATRRVPVTFVDRGVTHERYVNAVLKADGSYDATATKVQVGQVADGVAAKIAAGVLTNPPPPEPEVVGEE